MRKIKWIGLSPVENVFGTWQPGETKNIFDGTVGMPEGFVEVIEQPHVAIPAGNKKYQKYKTREVLQDRFERDNLKVSE